MQSIQLVLSTPLCSIGVVRWPDRPVGVRGVAFLAGSGPEWKKPVRPSCSWPTWSRNSITTLSPSRFRLFFAADMSHET